MKLLRRGNRDAPGGGRAEERFEHMMEAGDVPTFPSVVADAIQQVSCPEVDLGDVAVTMSGDPKLTVAVLKLANSPAFAPRSPITNLHQAAVLLGRNQLESLLIASGVAKAVPGEPAPGYSPQAFWRGSAVRAAAAAALAARVEPATQYDQFTAALLQDLAQPILMHHDRDYVQLVADCGSSHAELARLEAETLGWTHPEIGELLCRSWGLPDRLAASVSVHHDDPLDGFHIAQWASLIESPELDTDLLVADAKSRFGVSEDQVVDVLRVADERAGEIASVLA